MIEGALQPAGAIQHDIARSGFAVVPAARMRDLLTAVGPLSDWDRVAASWNDLALDTYMADGGRYRRRRYAVYEALPDGSIRRGAHQPHYQSREYNALNGGIPRWFEPIDGVLGQGPTMTSILRFCRTVFESIREPAEAGPHDRSAEAGPHEEASGQAGPHDSENEPAKAGETDVGASFSWLGDRWHIEAHQFRIEAQANQQGRPTPEGVHRDGVDYVLVMLVARTNIRSGTTTIHDSNGRGLGSFTLTEPFEAVLLDDTRVAHGVTPVEPLDPSAPAHRDVLVVTWTLQSNERSY